MGGFDTVDRTGTVPLLVEWKSTAEFGRVTTVDLYVGVRSDALDADFTYAPVQHGVRGIDATDDRHLDQLSVPDHLYVRAFAKTNGTGQVTSTGRPLFCLRTRGQCIERLAYANPIWVDTSSLLDTTLNPIDIDLAIQR